MRIFSFRLEKPFLGKFGPKNQNWYTDQVAYAEFNSGVHFFCFQPQIPFLGNFGPKNQNCQSELKFGTYTKLNMQNSMVVLTFSIFYPKYLFLGKFGPKNQSCQFELKFGTYTNSNMQNSIVDLLFLFSTGNTCFGQTWSKKSNLSV